MVNNPHNIWGKNGYFEGKRTYERHSVEHDVLSFMGWDNIDTTFNRMRFIKQNDKLPPFRDVGIASFKLAGRITEILGLDNRITKLVIDTDQTGAEVVVVFCYYVIKRYKHIKNKFGKDIFDVWCSNCGTTASLRDTFCPNAECGANLAIVGKKKFKTERAYVKRLPFYFPRSEKYTDDLIRIFNPMINNEPYHGLLFQSDYRKCAGKPLSYQWAYKCIDQLNYQMDNYGKNVYTEEGIAENKRIKVPLEWCDQIWNHRFRGQRISQLRDEYGYSEKRMKEFTGIVRSESLEHYYKDIKNSAEAMGLTLNEEIVKRWGAMNDKFDTHNMKILNTL